MPSREYNNLMRDLRNNTIKNFSNIQIKDFALPTGKYYAERIARDFNMTMHQLRRFFNEIKRVKTMLKMGKDVDFKNELALLHPLASYSRTRGYCSQEFTDFIRLAIDKIQGAQDFNVFEKFMMAIIAFSKK